MPDSVLGVGRKNCNEVVMMLFQARNSLTGG